MLHITFFFLPFPFSSVSFFTLFLHISSVVLVTAATARRFNWSFERGGFLFVFLGFLSE